MIQLKQLRRSQLRIRNKHTVPSEMTYKKGILLGQLTRTSGFEGEVVVKLAKNFIENIPLPESVFLEIDGRPVPFFVSSVDYPGSDILKLTFSGYNTISKVEEFKGCNVFLTTGETANDQEELSDLKGFSVHDQAGNLIGKIESIIENPGQLLLSIISPAKKEYLVPLHEDLIIKLDRKKRILTMDIPEGLIEIN
jgi:16S rRNA processing protein RimM